LTFSALLETLLLGTEQLPAEPLHVRLQLPQAGVQFSSVTRARQISELKQRLCEPHFFNLESVDQV
jgi:hypothetical protein